MDKHEYILTIAIPTWNRSFFLKRLLESVFTQLPLNGVRVIVADNHSSDSTQELCARYSENKNFSYIRHSENIGPEGNFLFCINNVKKSKFFWLLGDDEYLEVGALELILNELKTQRKKFFILNYYSFSKSDPSNLKLSYDESISIENLNDQNQILGTFGITLGFISGQILNSQLFDFMDKEEYMNISQTGMSHFDYILNIIPRLKGQIGVIRFPVFYNQIQHYQTINDDGKSVDDVDWWTSIFIDGYFLALRKAFGEGYRFQTIYLLLFKHSFLIMNYLVNQRARSNLKIRHIKSYVSRFFIINPLSLLSFGLFLFPSFLLNNIKKITLKVKR